MAASQEQEVRNFLPISSAVSAFDKVFKEFSDVPTDPDQLRESLLRRLFLNSVSYLSVMVQDPLVVQAAERTWEALKDRVPISTPDCITSQTTNGANPESKAAEERPSAIFRFEGEMNSAEILIPPGYADYVRKEPLKTLASAAWLCSLIEDFITGNYISSPPIARFHKAARVEERFSNELRQINSPEIGRIFVSD